MKCIVVTAVALLAAVCVADTKSTSTREVAKMLINLLQEKSLNKMSKRIETISRASSEWVIYRNHDCEGNDISGIANIYSIESCLDKCAAVANCVAVVYVDAWQKCHLKSYCVKKIDNRDIGVHIGIKRVLITGVPMADWPQGRYGLVEPAGGCPAGNWVKGRRYFDTEDSNSNNAWSAGIHLKEFGAGGSGKENMQWLFCMKTQSTTDGPPTWPNGKYCIFKKGGSCPAGMTSGWIKWDDEDSSNKNIVQGIVPDGVYNKDTIIYFCCMTGGDVNTPLLLPTNRPFYLFPLEAANPCQAVSGMKVRREWFKWDCEDSNNANALSWPYPDDSSSVAKDHVINMCFYYPMCWDIVATALGGSKQKKADAIANCFISGDWGEYKAPGDELSAFGSYKFVAAQIGVMLHPLMTQADASNYWSRTSNKEGFVKAVAEVVKSKVDYLKSQYGKSEVGAYLTAMCNFEKNQNKGEILGDRTPCEKEIIYLWPYSAVASQKLSGMAVQYMNALTFDLTKAQTTNCQNENVFVKNLKNDHPTAVSKETVKFIKSVKETKSYSMTAGFSLTAGMKYSVKAGIPGIGEASSEVSLSATVSTSFTNGKTEESTKTYEYTNSVTLKPGEHVLVLASVERCMLTVPYTAELKLENGMSVYQKGTYSANNTHKMTVQLQDGKGNKVPIPSQ